MTAMLADHIGAILFPQYVVFRIVGRISFPIFCFMLTEGFLYTGSRKKYIIRLLAFAVLSEIPYDFAFSLRTVNFGKQNVIFTLFLGVVMLSIFEKCANMSEKIICVLSFFTLAELFRIDYGGLGILLILIFYQREKYPVSGSVAAGLWNFLSGSRIQFFGVLSMIPISMYNREKGRSLKYLFYIFYPVHLLVLTGIAQYIGGGMR